MKLGYQDLLDFIDRHPEYFESTDSIIRFKSRFGLLFDEYARARDPRLYREIRELFEAAVQERQKSWEQRITLLEEEIRNLREQSRSIESKAELLKNIKPERAKKAESFSVVADAKGKSWFPLLLDISGALLLYFGFLSQHEISLSFVFLGCILIFFGFSWSAKQAFSSHGRGATLALAGSRTSVYPQSVRRGSLALLESHHEVLMKSLKQLEKEKAELMQMLNQSNLSQ